MSFFEDPESGEAGPAQDQDGPVRLRQQSWFEDVREFVRGAQGDAAIPGRPTFQNPTIDLYTKLVKEELGETAEALQARDVVGLADGIADSIWVLMGLAIAAGIDLRPVWAEVARSNLEKLGGPRREDGKLLKPSGWKPPDIAGALAKGDLTR